MESHLEPQSEPSKAVCSAVQRVALLALKTDASVVFADVIPVGTLLGVVEGGLVCRLLGVVDGIPVGSSVGVANGAPVGSLLGVAEGIPVCKFSGFADWILVGSSVGVAGGALVSLDGLDEGSLEGS